MRGRPAEHFLSGFWVTSLGTLASRVLGLLRDVATASLLGLAGGGVMDAFVIAFRIPNLLRRILGEGALANSYLPVLSGELEQDRARAAQLATAVIAWLAAVLTLVLLLGELACGAVWLCSNEPRWRLLAGLSAAMLPYLWFICLAAQLSATLQAAGRFGLPALSAAVLNVGWLAGAWWIAPRVTTDPTQQAYVLAACIVASGALQAGLQLPLLWRLGFRPRAACSASRESCRRILRTMGPLTLALAVTQINTFVDSLMAWGLTAAPGTDGMISWLPGELSYPLRTGATAALYYGERFYQLPVGLLGVAAATAIFPRLSRHAAHGRRADLATDLTRGLQWICFLSLPASAGLALLAGPLARVCLHHGAFQADDASRAAGTIAAYALGVGAYCALPVLARGYYALHDARIPLVAGVAALAANAALDLLLVWPLGEVGLALATAISSGLQLLLLAALFSRRHLPLDWLALRTTALKTAASTAALAAALVFVRDLPTEAGSACSQWLGLAAAVLTGGAAFWAAAYLLGCQELGWFLPQRGPTGQPGEPLTAASK